MTSTRFAKDIQFTIVRETQMDTYQHFKLTQIDDGLLVVDFDVADAPVNIFNLAVLNELWQIVDAVSVDASAKRVLFRSVKVSGFCAGADLTQIEEVDTPVKMERLLKLGQDVFERIANLPMLTACLIHGPCLGGGLEFAMACDVRIACDLPSTRLGLPETQLGLIPGWGGTQRLPKLVGLKKAVTMILTGQKVSAREAKRIGLVHGVIELPNKDELLTDDNLRNCVEELNRLIESRSKTSRKSDWFHWFLDDTSVGQRMVISSARASLKRKGLQYPALPAALKAIEQGIRGTTSAGYKSERTEFLNAFFTQTRRNLTRLFFDRERARNVATWVKPSGDRDGMKSDPIKTVAVIGGGIMGAGIAQASLLAGYDVVVKELNPDLALSARARIDALLQKAVDKGFLSADDRDERRAHLNVTSLWTPVESADLVVEAVVEIMDVKHDLFAELENHVSPSTLLTSNTSALSVTKMTAGISHPERLAGLHFFNPVHKMPLVEIVTTNGLSDHSRERLVRFVKSLGKTPVLVRDEPGFLVNRILFPYMDEAVRLVSEGVRVKDIDSAAVKLGMPMGPLELLDTVGLDVAVHVAQSLEQPCNDSSPTAHILEEMIARNHLGRKTSCGFYEYEDGKKTNVAQPQPIGVHHSLLEDRTVLNGETLTTVQQRLLFSMINTAAKVLEQGVVEKSWMVDLAMVMGTGFAPFHGGPLRLVDRWSATQVVNVLERLALKHGARFEPAAILHEFDETHMSFDDWDKIDAPNKTESPETIPMT